MKVKQVSTNKYLVVLDKGDVIMESLRSFHREYANENLCHVEGIGAVEYPIIGYLKHDKQYEFKTMQGDYEVLAIKGNITSLNNDTMSHLHVVLSDINMNSFGGHLKDATVSVTLECFIEVFDTKVEREMNPNIGINLINF